MKKPHLLFITMDELSFEALGCYGGTAVPTPHMDDLAAEGTLYRRAFASSPLCLPARVTLATGRYPHETGCISNGLSSWLRTDVPNIYTLLKEAGYHTAHYGKCHYVPVRYHATRPDRSLDYTRERDYYLRLGMDDLCLQDDKHISVWFVDDYTRELEAAGHLEAYRAASWNREYAKVFPFPGPEEWHPDAWVGRKSCEYIEGHDPSRPLFLWVSFSGPHYPIDPPVGYLDRVNPAACALPPRERAVLTDPTRIQHGSFTGSDPWIDGSAHAPGRACAEYTDAYWHRLRQHYFANVALLDDWIGEIVTRARARFDGNVAVVLSCDHGDMIGRHGVWGKQGCANQPVMRIPFIVSPPFAGCAGVSDHLVSQVDVLPTLLHLAGAARRDDLSGCNLADLRELAARRYVFCEQERMAAVTDGRYKLIQARTARGALTEFFDLETDPGEYENLADAPQVTAEKSQLASALNHFHVPKHVSSAPRFFDAEFGGE